MDIRQLLLHIRLYPSDRRVKRETGVDRRTVKRYRAWAEGQGLLAGPLPALSDLQTLLDQTLPEATPPQNISSVEPYRALVVQWRSEHVEIAAIHQRLKERGFGGDYSAVYRFVRALEPVSPDVTVRVERQPGEEAQVDFGSAGRMLDLETNQWRKAWAFVMTLSWSRHQYVEFVFDQKVETWLMLHRHAFEFFGGVPTRLVIDNLKAAITQASWDEPQVQHTYAELAEHYGFLIAPCRIRTPQHKGKVEQGGVHYVKRNFLGGREPGSLVHNNQAVREWCLTTAGLRVHGTTKAQPLVRFQQTEQARLKPLPSTPYDLAVWKQVTLHRDCYVVFENAYYSAPHRLVGQTLWVSGGLKQVRIFTRDYQLVASHERAQQPGERHTHPDHLPPEKLPGLMRNREHCLASAQAIGPATHTVVQQLLADPVLDRLLLVGRILKLAERFGAKRLEAACARALDFDDPAYGTIKRILSEGLERRTTATLVVVPAATVFVRSAEELLGALAGGERWN